MPIGCVSCVPHVIARLAARLPGSVLDLGIGFGFYGAAIRQWLDNGVSPWQVSLTGVEGWEAYRNPAWDLYDRVYVEPIEQWLKEPLTLPVLDRGPEPRTKWDAILLMDVLEHFEVEAGYEVLARAYVRLSRGGVLIVGTPGVWIEQGAAYGNEFERHRSLWSAADLRTLGFEIITDGDAPDPWGNKMLLATRVRV